MGGRSPSPPTPGAPVCCHLGLVVGGLALSHVVGDVGCRRWSSPQASLGLHGLPLAALCP